MRYVLVLSVALLAGCGQQSSEDLAADPVRLKVLRAQCAADWRGVGEGVCRGAAEAYRRRFFAGHGGPEEYVALEELPPIPPTFDSPVDDEAETGRDAPAAFASEATQ
ncbi:MULTISPECIES: hypothetical protein [Pseudomonas]|uniref:Lipoprotein n=1 Tax=Pseudomonas lactis TaxID=1615674 RepID=A0ABS9FKR1_9PSED|nr:MULTISPECIES: hypothetical protein [Pseudomonas]MBH8759223.1 hypothetical protein [Pseudomonas aeruginosa]MCF4972055.1 hypothetical protein [Pseudomonas lactis]MCF5004200.1 hypothetical protein [Pseudomonas lactis]MCF5006078.1 hypothetical protein [Pseudomonas lactis]MCF5014185.1 hypothetical protein [Pseudomonas lactis]